MELRDSLTAYLKQAGKIRLLTAQEEKVLAERIAAGDRAAAKRLVEANLRLVAAIARRYANKGLPLDDLIQEGNFGLMIAAEKFDPAQGKFSTYATYWVRQCMGRAIFNTAGMVRLPVHAAEQRNKLYKRRQELASNGDAQPSYATLAEESGLAVEEVERLLGTEQFGLSLDHEYEGTERSLYDMLEDSAPSPYEAAEASQRAAHIRRWLDRLNDKQRFVIERRFGFDGRPEQTLEEVAQGLGLTRERIRQIEKIALNNIRKAAKHAALRGQA